MTESGLTLSLRMPCVPYLNSVSNQESFSLRGHWFLWRNQPRLTYSRKKTHTLFKEHIITSVKKQRRKTSLSKCNNEYNVIWFHILMWNQLRKGRRWEADKSPGTGERLRNDGERWGRDRGRRCGVSKLRDEGNQPNMFFVKACYLLT